MYAQQHDTRLERTRRIRGVEAEADRVRAIRAASTEGGPLKGSGKLRGDVPKQVDLYVKCGEWRMAGKECKERGDKVKRVSDRFSHTIECLELMAMAW